MSSNKHDVTEIATKLFGDIVEYAYYKKEYFDDISEKTFQKDVLSDNDNENNIDLTLSHLADLVVKFKNGNEVKIKASEWGYIEKHNQNITEHG